MRTYKLLLDLDGVIADFDRAMSEAHGIDREAFWAKSDHKGVWDTPRLLNMTWNEWWEPATSVEFWETLPKTPEADKIIARVQEAFGEDNIAIMTNPSGETNAVIGKLRWIEEHVPQFKENVLIGSAKHIFASPCHVLLDDGDHNVQAFEENGGAAVLLPRPWNKLWAKAHEPLWAVEKLAIIYGRELLEK